MFYITSTLSSKEIALRLGISKRYVNKLKEKYKKRVQHVLSIKTRVSPKKTKTSIDTEEKIISLYKEKYERFNFVHFNEKLRILMKRSKYRFTVFLLRLHRSAVCSAVRSFLKHKNSHPSFPIANSLKYHVKVYFYSLTSQAPKRIYLLL